MSDLFHKFLHESHELVEQLESQLMQLERAHDDPEIVHGLFRTAHTLKGNSAMVNQLELVRFTHVLENVLAALRDGQLTAQASLVDELLRAVDVLKTMLDGAAPAGADVAGDGPPRSYQSERQALERLLGAPIDSTGEELLLPTAKRELLVELRFTCAPEAIAAAAASLLADMALLGTISALQVGCGDARCVYTFVLFGDARFADIEAFAMFADAEVSIQDLSPAQTPVQPQPDSSAALTPRRASHANARSPSPGRDVRVDAVRFDSLVELACEMVVAAARVDQLLHDQYPQDMRSRDAMQELNALVRDVQERSVALRMVPVRETFLRFERPVRDLARDLGKQVSFESHGLETEVDRKLLDQLADPLKHLVRNAIAHGIESPELRQARGKPAAGRLALCASQQNGTAIIEICDDGAGIETERVVSKAIAKGLLPAGAQPSRREVFDILFLPGFSTAERVDEVAGRGVGLDVLKRTVEDLRGQIEVTSEPGAGTTFRVRLPTTLAILDGMHVRAAGRSLVIPMTAIVTTKDVASAKPRRDLHGNTFIELDQKQVPVIDLAELFGAPHASNAGTIIVVRTQRHRFGMVVESALGLMRAMIKPLPPGLLRSVRPEATAQHPGSGVISGATVLPNGSVGLIIDPSGVEATLFGSVATAGAPKLSA